MNREPLPVSFNRREFLKTSAVAGGVLAGMTTAMPVAANAAAEASATPPGLPDLNPAKWLWYPSGRCLQNTFVLFRRELELPAKPRRATGWISADSRYLLQVNNRRIQWGPPPCDPRWLEADPLDLATTLQAGKNVLAATVLFYGVGDGTWPTGKPGFLFWLDIEHADGRREKIVSDANWQTCLARAWRPGQYKRWFLRALQEEFDARRYPHGWATSDFQPDRDWLPAMPLGGSPNKPAVCTGYDEYQSGIHADARLMELRPRSIPLLRESLVPVDKLAESCWLDWQRPPEEYFEMRVPNAFRKIPGPAGTASGSNAWTVKLDGTRGAVLTFELKEQVVGWPYFTIDAPAGTVVELLVHEAHRVDGPVLLNTHFDSWTRFICRDGENRFETFDFESLRWLQLHVHGPAGEVRVRDLGVRRRVFPWPNEPQVRIGEPVLQRLMDASINTLHNSAQETLVDGMARERQQYSGDGAHQSHAVYLAFGETRLPGRFVTTFSQGMTLDGYFLDCWPAYDRLARIMQRQVQLTGWGPILDHGVEFNFDCWHHYLYTADLEPVREAYPRLLRFAEYLRGIRHGDGLLPVENLGVPSVWIDHVAYRQQRHKQCAFNLYVAAAMEHALAPLCRAFGDEAQAAAIRRFGREVQSATVRQFWSGDRGLFVNNLPWLADEKTPRLCDRSLATAVLFEQCPAGRTKPSLKVLAECPAEMGFSYPCNAGWRLWALARGGCGDVVVKDLRERWAKMDSVQLNNTLQEDWHAPPDSGAQWSHCAVVPLYVLFQDIAGIRPTAPGFSRFQVRPQLGDLPSLELTAFTVRGPIAFSAQRDGDAQRVTIRVPAGCKGELLLPLGATAELPTLTPDHPLNLKRFALAGGKAHSFRTR